MADSTSIQFTSDELRTLMEMITVAMNISQEYEIDNEEDENLDLYNDFEKVEQKVFSVAHRTGEFRDMVSKDVRENAYYMNPTYEDESSINNCIEAYRDSSFWEELVLHMADADLERRIGSLEMELLTEEEKREQTENIEKRLWAEFDENGVDNLHIIHPHDKG